MSGVPLRKLALVSLLPPPAGGIASWTERILRRGLPGGFVPVLVDQGYRSSRAVFAKRISLWAEAKRTTRVAASLLRTIVRERPVAVHLNCHLSRRGVFRDLLCAAVARVCGTPLVTHYRGNVGDFPSGGSLDLPSLALRRLMLWSDVNVTVNRPSASFAAEKFRIRTAVVVPNFIDDAPLPQDLAPAAQHVRARVIYAGGISKNKGVADIFAVAERLPSVEFLLVGAVPDPAVLKLIKTKNVTVVPEKPRAEVLAAMADSTLLLFPSYSEGFPNVVLEAMFVGIPVVSTTVGAIPDMIEEGSGGRLVRCGDIEGLTRAVEALVENQSACQAMGNFNREKCRREYSYDVVTRQLVDIYENLLSSGGAHALSAAV